jgi:ankyrin repeat protein
MMKIKSVIKINKDKSLGNILGKVLDYKKALCYGWLMTAMNVSLATQKYGAIRFQSFEEIFQSHEDTQEVFQLLDEISELANATMTQINKDTIDINATNIEGQTLLTCAIKARDMHSFNYLMDRYTLEQKKIQLNKADNNNRRPLYYACRLALLPEAAKVLLGFKELLLSDANKGMKEETSDQKGNQEVRILNEDTQEVFNLLEQRENLLNKIIKLINGNTVNMDTTDTEGCTILMRVIKAREIFLFRYCVMSYLCLLPRQTADQVNKSDNKNNTPLHYAVSVFPEAVEALTSYVGLGINAQNKTGETPLHVALRLPYPDPSLINTLLQVPGIDVNKKDKNDFTPFRIIFDSIVLCTRRLFGTEIPDGTEIPEEDEEELSDVEVKDRLNRDLEIAKQFLKHPVDKQLRDRMMKIMRGFKVTQGLKI